MSSMGSAAEARAILYPYQRRWIDDQSRFKIGMFSRQTGKTYTSTLEIAEDMVKAEVEKRRVRWVILSRGERQAREAMEEGLKVHLRAYGAAFESLESDFHLADATSCKSLEVVMAHGSRVTALPANPDTARGFSANVFLDEFAFHADSRKIWAALFPVVSRNGLKLRVVSTPNGKGNKFYDLMTSAETAGWSKHVVDIYQAVADGLPRDVEALRAALNDPDAWAQEYELQWLDEASAWLSYDLINAVEHERAGIAQNYAGGPCYVGVDIGRRHYLFVIWVLEEVGDVLWTREIITRRGASFAEQDGLLDDVFRRYRVLRCCMDQTGMGEKPWKTPATVTAAAAWKGFCSHRPASWPWPRWASRPLRTDACASRKGTRHCAATCTNCKRWPALRARPALWPTPTAGAMQTVPGPAFWLSTRLRGLPSSCRIMPCPPDRPVGALGASLIPTPPSCLTGECSDARHPCQPQRPACPGGHAGPFRRHP